MSSTRVLLIDDEKDFCVIVKTMLKRAPQDYEVTWIDNRTDALAAMVRNEYDVCVIDYQLREGNGLDLLREALAQDMTTPAIVVTSHSDLEVDFQALEAGATDYVDKTELTTRTLHRAIRYALAHARMIRERKESEQRYRRLIEDAFDGILTTDKKGKILLANNRIREMLRHPRGELTGMNVKELLTPAEEENPLLTPGNGVVAEHVLHCGDGQDIPVEISAKDVGNDQLQFIARDISERKTALEEREKNIERLTILHQVDEELSQELSIDYVLIMALDAAVRLSAAHAGFVGLVEGDRIRLSQVIGPHTGAKTGDFLPDTPFIRRLMADLAARLIPDVEQEPDAVVFSKRTRSQMILPLITSDRLIGILKLEAYDTERFTQETLEFLKLITARVAVAIDNARLYKISQDQLAELKKLYAEVSRLEQLKTDMIRIASHDLRNPVGVVLGYVELIQQFSGDTLDPKVAAFLSTIERSARRMERITTDILSLERIESSLHSETMEPLNMSDLVYEVSREFTDQAQVKSLTLHRDIPDTVITVQGDVSQLREAVANILNNAIKYTPENSSIRVTLYREGDEAILKVADTGYGIPEEKKSELFQAFHRVESEETAAIEGTGLGLYLAKNIVERHGGSIIFESEYGEGSTFGFRLPIA